MHRGEENLFAAVIAIVDYFHGPHRLASEELASSGLTGTEIPRGLIESHPANGAGYVSNTLWTNSIPIHHPEENEFFAALRAPGDKLVHKALSHTGFSAPYSMGSASLSYDGDHGAAHLLIILFAFPALAMQNPIPSTQCLNSRPVDVQFRVQQVRMSLSAAGRPKGEGGVLLLAGRALPVGSCKFIIRGLGLREELGLPVICKKTESPHAKRMTKEMSSFCSDRQLRTISSPCS